MVVGVGLTRSILELGSRRSVWWTFRQGLVFGSALSVKQFPAVGASDFDGRLNDDRHVLTALVAVAIAGSAPGLALAFQVGTRDRRGDLRDGRAGQR